MSRTDQERCTVNIGGRDLGVFDMFSGGEADSDDTKHRGGGMGPEESLGGPRSRGDFTLSRLYKLERDHGLAKFLDSQAGNGKVVATRTMLTRDRVATGEPITFTGTLKTFNHPDHDSNSSDKKMVSMVVSADEPIS